MKNKTESLQKKELPMRYLKHMKLSLIIIGFMSFITLPAFAQPGNNKVVIQGKFTPSVSDAQKMNSSPILHDTVYKVPEFSYNIMEKKVETPFKVSSIRPAKLLGEPLNKLYSNYVAIGMGNYLSPFFEFYHSKLRSRNTKYGVHLKHFSSAGSINDYGFPAWSNNLVEVYGSKFWKKSVFDVSAKYKRDVTHYYGFKPTEYPDSLLPKDVDIVQLFNLVSTDLHWYRYRLRKKEMDYDINLNYYFLQDYYNSLEHKITFDSRLDWYTDFIKSAKYERLGFEIENELYINDWEVYDGTSMNMFTLKPFYKLEYGLLSLKVGVDMQIISYVNSNLYFYPRAELNLAAIPEVLYFNFSLTGGNYRNSLKLLTDENPFVNTTMQQEFTNRKYQINFGLGSSISKSVNFDIQLYYDKLERAPLFITDTNSTYNNQFTVVYEDYDRLNLQMDLAYRLHDRLSFLMRSNYYVYNMTTQLYAWHKPNYDFSLSANYNIQDKIFFKAEFITYGSSTVPVWDEKGKLSPQTLKAWVDLNIGVEYRYRKKLGLFVNFNNVTASRYYRWYNYPSYKFNFMAGLSYIF